MVAGKVDQFVSKGRTTYLGATIRAEFVVSMQFFTAAKAVVHFVFSSSLEVAAMSLHSRS